MARIRSLFVSAVLLKELVGAKSDKLLGTPVHLLADRAGTAAASDTPEVDVVIEIPRFSFFKRGSGGAIDFISPLPCPFNYGSVPNLIGLEGDLLDALVLGPRLALGTRVRVPAWGAVTFTDRGMSDDKLVCARAPISAADREAVLRFFRRYARCKGWLNFLRGRPGRNACDGWREAQDALGRATPRTARWRGPAIGF
jgi:inorganic pyrophosphatase